MNIASPAAFGDTLRAWRGRRGLSQLDLALSAGVSQRHLSFLESGRSKPSREMVHLLASMLDMPLRQQNSLMLAAGFAPAWRETALDAPDMADVNRALDFLLQKHEPYPAFVVDRLWNLRRANDGAVRLIQKLFGAMPEGPLNLMHLTFSPEGLRPLIVNWEEAARWLLPRLHAEVLNAGPDDEAAATLLRELMAYPGMPKPGAAATAGTLSPVLTMEFRHGDTSLSLFSTVTTLGTPRDVTLQEIHIECFFPADAASATALERLASG